MAVRRTKRADGRFTVTLTHEGKRHFFHGRTQAEAKAQEARERLRAGTPVRDASRTLSDWLGEWRDTFLRASDRSQSTQKSVRGPDEASR